MCLLFRDMKSFIQETWYENAFCPLSFPTLLLSLAPSCSLCGGLLRQTCKIKWLSDKTLQVALKIPSTQFRAFKALWLWLEAFWNGIFNSTWKSAGSLFQPTVSHRLVAFSVWGQISSRSQHPTVSFSVAEQMPKLSGTFRIPVLPLGTG